MMNTTSSNDAVPCSFGEAQSSNGYFGHGGQADVAGHCANLDDDLGGEVGGLGGLICDPEEGEVGAVVLGEAKSVKDYLDSV